MSSIGHRLVFLFPTLQLWKKTDLNTVLIRCLKPLPQIYGKNDTLSSESKDKEELGMDILMIGTLGVSFLIIKLFADWCGRQVEKS